MGVSKALFPQINPKYCPSPDLVNLQLGGSDGCCSSLHTPGQMFRWAQGRLMAQLGSLALTGSCSGVLLYSCSIGWGEGWLGSGSGGVGASGASGLHETDGEIRSVLNQHPLNKHTEILLWTALSRVALLAGPC